jgi:hypothetical protein
MGKSVFTVHVCAFVLLSRVLYLVLIVVNKKKIRVDQYSTRAQDLRIWGDMMMKEHLTGGPKWRSKSMQLFVHLKTAIFLSCILQLYVVFLLVILSCHEGLRQVALEWNLEMMILMLTSHSKSDNSSCFFPFYFRCMDAGFVTFSYLLD